MSIDLNWENLTTGDSGDALTEQIRDFIHAKFQTVPLPRFLRSVTVHGFEFGNIPPEVELKDITDPLPDFYDAEAGDDSGDEGEEEQQQQQEEEEEEARADERRRRRRGGGERPNVRSDLGSPFLGVGTPGMMRAGNLHYFQAHLASGFSGAQTPLAAVAGGNLGNGWASPRRREEGPASPQDVSPSHSRNASHSSVSDRSFDPASLAPPEGLREKGSVSTLGASRPPTRETALSGSAIGEDEEEESEEEGQEGPAGMRTRREPRVEDMQAVFRIKYAGDVKLMLTAVILLDYPMPSFVGIPVKLNITGLTFDGIGVLAYIRKKVHFCFLSPEDALAAVGPDDDDGDGSDGRKGKFGGLLQEVKVESEIGEREAGRQSLKNVGKVERFVLEQVRRIFEDEFVYPSFWTFLV